QELASYAEQRGAQVLWGWCYEGEGAPPYWPWVQLMRAYVQQAGTEQLTAEMGPGAADIAEIVPEIRGKLPDLETPPVLEPEPARFRLFDSITTFLKNAAQRQPLMLVLDDLHWADRSSLLLLEFLAREIGTSRLLLVGAYRDVEVSRRHPLSQTLGTLVREQIFHRVQLDGLTQQEVGELVEGSAGITLTLEAAEVIHKRTDGNPFFVGEITRQVTLDNITEDQGWASVIPEGVRDAIGRRLIRLSDQCNQMLTTASIIGRRFEFRLLKSLLGDAIEGQLLGAMDEAVGSLMIEELPQSVGLYQFTHDLIRETLMEELSTIRRVQLHARIAQALEALYEDDAEAHAAELAHHFAEAHTVLGAEKLVLYSLMAGEQALAGHAHEDAVEHYQRGLEAKQGQEIDGDVAALLFGLGRAQAGAWERWRVNEAVNTVKPAFDYYVAAGDVQRALAIANYPFSFGTVEILDQALKLVPPGSLDSGRILARYGRGLNFVMGGPGGREQVSDTLGRALEIAQRENDTALELDLLGMLASIHWFDLNFHDCLENSLRAIELSSRLGLQEDASLQWYAVRVLIALGNPAEARIHATVQLELLEKYGRKADIAQALHGHEVLAQFEGKWEAAREFSDRGLAVDYRNVLLLHWRAILEYEEGSFSQGAHFLERILETIHMTDRRLHPEDVRIATLTMALAARITGIENGPDLAEFAVEQIPEPDPMRPFWGQLARTGMALVAVENGDLTAAREQYEFLKDRAIGVTPLNMVCGYRVLGLLSQTLGDLNQATAYFEESLAYCRKAGYRPELAWTCCDYADALQERNNPDDRGKAKAHLDEALVISSELGMRPLMERVAGRLETLQALPQRATSYPGGLSVREVEVLLLIAQGNTNREIANELVLSQRTVQRHIANIYAKISVRNRAEATTFALAEFGTPT
ncbi:MAG: AAA family ATPase, partial [Chloroflexi bacterium]|nr:AAA family ATPase [Chloroflexota bacterium]